MSLGRTSAWENCYLVSHLSIWNIRKIIIVCLPFPLLLRNSNLIEIYRNVSNLLGIDYLTKINHIDDGGVYSYTQPSLKQKFSPKLSDLWLFNKLCKKLI